MLLDRGADLNAQVKYGETVLHIAVRNGYMEIVQMLLDRGANVDVQDESGETVLHCAVRQCYIELVKVLLDRGANVYAHDMYGDTVLHCAAETGCSVIAEHILKHCPDVNNINSKTKGGRTALHIAALADCLEVVEVLLKYGASIDSKDECGETALHNACEERHDQIVIALLEHGSDINIMNTNNETPLDYADDGISSINIELYGDDFSTADILKRHVVKMKTANLFVSKNNLLSINDTDEISDFQNGCEEEIASMKAEKVGNANVSFYDILTKDVSQLAMYAGNDSIVQILRSDDYKIKFPIYASMINRNFKKGERRKELLEQGNNIFHLLFNNFPQLPHDCTQKIFSYLSDEDLRILIDACKPVSVSSPNTDINNVATT
jgi:ankyrin repeat protein